MPKFHFSVDSKKVRQMLHRAAVVGKDTKKPLEEAGIYVLRQSDLSFAKERQPNGAKWTQLKESTKKKRRKGKKSHGERILQDTGTLRNSVSVGQQGNVFRSDSKSVEVGTNVPYANVHQFGAKIQKKARKVKVLHKLNKNNTDFMRQKKHPNLLVFGSKKHKNVIEREFMAKAHTINIPARPFLGITAQHGKVIVGIIGNYIREQMKK